MDTDMPRAARSAPNAQSGTFRISGVVSRLVFAATVLAVSSTAWAQNKPPEELQPIPEVEDSALPKGIGEESKPLVTVRRQDGTEFKEYRVRGSVLAVKVTPKVGPVYWLIRREGNLVRHDAPGPNLTVPSWLVLEW
jgi:hypothetical protein